MGTCSSSNINKHKKVNLTINTEKVDLQMSTPIESRTTTRTHEIPETPAFCKPNIQLCPMTNETPTKENINNENKAKLAETQMIFQRNTKRSVSLIEKCKSGVQLFQEEIKLCVNNGNLVEEAKGIPKSKYKILSKLGDGSYGNVYLVRNNFTKNQVAMKKIEKIKQSNTEEAIIKNEIQILKNLGHPNIVKIFECYTTDKYYYIITEYCRYGELYSKIKVDFNEKQLAVIFFQVFSGLSYLHFHHIIHRDLKLENILIDEIQMDKSGDSLYSIKIIDFGTAQIFEKSEVEKKLIGSSYYIAPEALNKNYNEKCDMWSAGIILYMLIVGRAPFDGENDFEIMAKVKSGMYDTSHKRLTSSSPEVQDLLGKLLEVDIQKRYSANEALMHPWFTKNKTREFLCTIPIDKILHYINNLFHYQVHSKFQQIVLAFVVHNITECEETKDILKLFRLLNEKSDGKLTKEELYKGLCKYKRKDDVDMMIDDIFLFVDGDNNGFIEYEEFLRACVDQKKILSEDMLSYAFKFFDRDNSNKISLEAIKKNFCGENDKVSEEVFKNIFKEIDVKGDGEIDFEEFKAMMLPFNE